MKKIVLKLSILALLVCALSIPASAFAVENTRTTEIIYVEGLGEVEVTTITKVQNSLVRSSQKSASKTKEFTYDGQVVATVTLKATFGYDGSSAWVVSATGSQNISSGWTYKNQSIDKSGNSATLTATLSKGIGVKTPVEITMSCSPSGTIS